MKVKIHPFCDEFCMVQQDEVVVAAHDVELRTYGMSTCSALVLIGKHQKLLAHVDAQANKADLEKVITEYFDLSDNSLQIFIVPGDGGLDVSTELSEAIINDVLYRLNLSERALLLENMYTDCIYDLVVRDGVSVEEERLRKSRVIQHGDLKYHFACNVFPEQITDLGNGGLKISFDQRADVNEAIHEHAIIGITQDGDDGMVGVYAVRVPVI